MLGGGGGGGGVKNVIRCIEGVIQDSECVL